MNKIRPSGKYTLAGMVARAKLALTGANLKVSVRDNVVAKTRMASYKREKDGYWAHPKLRQRSKYRPHQGPKEIERRRSRCAYFDPVYFDHHGVVDTQNSILKPLKGDYTPTT